MEGWIDGLVDGKHDDVFIDQCSHNLSAALSNQQATTSWVSLRSTMSTWTARVDQLIIVELVLSTIMLMLLSMMMMMVMMREASQYTSGDR